MQSPHIRPPYAKNRHNAEDGSRRARWLRTTGRGVLTVAVAGLFLAACGGGSSEAVIYTGVGVEADLATRAEAAGVAIVANESETTHTHTKLRIIVDDTEIEVPGDIGVDREAGVLTILHTHKNDGVIHVESPNADDTYTLAQFMHLWGIGGTAEDLCHHFTENPYCSLRIESAATGETGLDTILQDDDEIVIEIVTLA